MAASRASVEFTWSGHVRPLIEEEILALQLIVTTQWEYRVIGVNISKKASLEANFSTVSSAPIGLGGKETGAIIGIDCGESEQIGVLHVIEGESSTDGDGAVERPSTPLDARVPSWRASRHV